MSAMSSGLRLDMSSTGTPSTTMSGEDVAPFDSVPVPRILMEGAALKSPLLVVMVRPGIAPWRARVTSCTGRLSMTRATSTVATAPVRLAFFCVP